MNAFTCSDTLTPPHWHVYHRWMCDIFRLTSSWHMFDDMQILYMIRYCLQTKQIKQNSVYVLFYGICSLHIQGTWKQETNGREGWGKVRKWPRPGSNLGNMQYKDIIDSRLRFKSQDWFHWSRRKLVVDIHSSQHTTLIHMTQKKPIDIKFYCLFFLW